MIDTIDKLASFQAAVDSADEQCIPLNSVLVLSFLLNRKKDGDLTIFLRIK